MFSTYILSKNTLWASVTRKSRKLRLQFGEFNRTAWNPIRITSKPFSKFCQIRHFRLIRNFCQIFILENLLKLFVAWWLIWRLWLIAIFVKSTTPIIYINYNLVKFRQICCFRPTAIIDKCGIFFKSVILPRFLWANLPALYQPYNKRVKTTSFRHGWRGRSKQRIIIRINLSISSKSWAKPLQICHFRHLAKSWVLQTSLFAFTQEILGKSLSSSTLIFVKFRAISVNPFLSDHVLRGMIYTYLWVYSPNFNAVLSFFETEVNFCQFICCVHFLPTSNIARIAYVFRQSNFISIVRD